MNYYVWSIDVNSYLVLDNIWRKDLQYSPVRKYIWDCDV